MAELRVSFDGAFLCRAISPELAGETIALKDIIRARNERRRELRTTLAEREATVEALLQPVALELVAPGLRQADAWSVRWRCHRRANQIQPAPRSFVTPLDETREALTPASCQWELVITWRKRANRQSWSGEGFDSGF